ncbi:hypothetical protein EFP34_11770 [Lacticaseibacillus paracasei]|uniref:YopX family protein n=1 Tax=Lacticaseibacillus paracasei TaxID=1597 RepID=UPI0021A73C03|nr:YopX family protein [Lacticaseibacillus paracasei]MCT3351183.1 hypothetical protein [Lacticaseibacillus paracasei]
MKREIKFRAWDKVYECYLYDVQNAYDTLSGCVKDENGEDAGYDEECFAGFLDNDQYVVEQYTGLHDKNGREIYEGDIIVTHPKSRYEAPKSGVVQFGGSCPSFGYKTEDREEYDIWSSNAYRTYEVIGNIFENPELLEAQHE